MCRYDIIIRVKMQFCIIGMVGHFKGTVFIIIDIQNINNQQQINVKLTQKQSTDKLTHSDLDSLLFTKIGSKR